VYVLCALAVVGFFGYRFWQRRKQSAVSDQPSAVSD